MRSLHPNFARRGDFDFEALIQYDAVVLKGVLKPELAGNYGLGAIPVGLILEGVAFAKSLYGNMFFSEVAIERSAAGDFGIEVLDVFWWSNYRCAIGFADTDIIDIDGLGSGLEKESSASPTA